MDIELGIANVATTRHLQHRGGRGQRHRGHRVRRWSAGTPIKLTDDKGRLDHRRRRTRSDTRYIGSETKHAVGFGAL